MLLIPNGEEGPLVCQSASLIRTIMVYTGKDSSEHLANNIEPILEEVEHLEQHGLRYNATLKTYLGQVSKDGSKAEKKEGDRDVRVRQGRWAGWKATPPPSPRVAAWWWWGVRCGGG